MATSRLKVAGEVTASSAWVVALLVYVMLGASAVYALPSVLVSQTLTPREIGELTAVERSSAIASARQAVLFATGGLLAVITLALTQRRDAVARARHEIDRDANWTNRYTEAVKQLGDEQAAVRYGGIYALGRIAEDSRRDRNSIVEVLMAYIREADTVLREETVPLSDAAKVDEATASHAQTGTSQAALTIVGRLLKVTDDPRPRVNLPDVHIGIVDLTYGDLREADFSRSHLNGSRFQGAQLAQALFVGANIGSAQFDGVSAHTADFSASRAAHARFPDARLLRTDFSAAKLMGTRFDRAIIRGASFAGADMTKANFSHTDLERANLSGAILH